MGAVLGGYIKRLLVALDIFFNVALLFGGVETVSSRCGKRIVAAKPCRACGLLCNAIDRAFGGRWKNHCINNINPVSRETVPAKEA